MYTVYFLMYLIFLICASLPTIYAILILHSMYHMYTYTHCNMVYIYILYMLQYIECFCLSEYTQVINHSSNNGILTPYILRMIRYP